MLSENTIANKRFIDIGPIQDKYLIKTAKEDLMYGIEIYGNLETYEIRI